MGGQSVGIFVVTFLQTVRAGSPSVARLSLSRRPTFSSVSTLRRRLVGVFGSFCHHRLARRWSGFQGFLPASQIAKHGVGSVEGIFILSADSGQAATTLEDPKMFDLTKHGTLHIVEKLSISISSMRSWNWARGS